MLAPEPESGKELGQAWALAQGRGRALEPAQVRELAQGWAQVTAQEADPEQVREPEPGRPRGVAMLSPIRRRHMLTTTEVPLPRLWTATRCDASLNSHLSHFFAESIIDASDGCDTPIVW